MLREIRIVARLLISSLMSSHECPRKKTKSKKANQMLLAQGLGPWCVFHSWGTSGGSKRKFPRPQPLGVPQEQTAVTGARLCPAGPQPPQLLQEEMSEGGRWRSRGRGCWSAPSLPLTCDLDLMKGNPTLHLRKSDSSSSQEMPMSSCKRKGISRWAAAQTQKEMSTDTVLPEGSSQPAVTVAVGGGGASDPDDPSPAPPLRATCELDAS